MKKLIISLLSLLMVFGLMMPISAEGETPATEPLTCESGGVVACVDGVGYEKLSDAFANAQEGQTVSLLNDYDKSEEPIEINKSVTFDLNGFDLKVASTVEGQIKVTNGVFTFKDSKNSGKLYTDTLYENEATGYGVIESASNTSTVVIESGHIETIIESDPSGKGQFGVVVSNGGKIVVNGGKIEAGWYAISGNGNDATTNSNIEINGGEIISKADYAIYHPQNGKLTVNNGVIYGAAGGISLNRGEIEVNGGTITSKGQGNTGEWGDGTGGQGNAAINIQAKYGDSKVEINDGKIVAEGDAVIIDKGTTHEIDLGIEGGIFSNSVNEFLDEETLSVQTSANGVHYVGKKAKEVINSEGTETIIVNNGTDISVPAGVTVENKTGNDIKVNGDTVANNGSVEDVKVVAKIDGKNYSDLQTALNEATAGQKVELVENVELPEGTTYGFEVKDGVILEGNGNTIINNQDSKHAITMFGTSTVKNVNFVLGANAKYAIQAFKTQDATITNVKIDDNSEGFAGILVNGGTATVSGVEYAGNSYAVVELGKGKEDYPEPKITVDGKISATGGTTTAIYVAQEITNPKVNELITVTDKASGMLSSDSKLEFDENGNLVVTKPETKPTTPTISCAGSKDKNCDGVVTCDEEKGAGWTWNNAKKVCEYTGNSGYQVVNTAVK